MTAQSTDGLGADGFADLGRILVIIPTYNEAENIEAVVRRARAAVPEAHVLVADDNSPDGTGDLAAAMADADRQVAVLRRAGKEGLGAAYMAGFAWGIDHHFDVMVQMDADGSHAPEHLPRLLHGLREADVVIGSRWVAGGEVVNWPKHRELLSRAGSWYARRSLQIGVRDVTAGYRAYRRRALEKLDLSRVYSRGYCFQVDMTRLAIGSGITVAEVPITFVERERGQSKMSLAIVAEAMLRVTVWGGSQRLAKALQQRPPAR